MFNKNKILSHIILSLLLSIFNLFAFSEVALARAGGGGGGGHGGRYSGIAWLIAIVYVVIQFWLIKRKRAKATMLLERLSDADVNWDIDKIKERMETVFFKVQEAWMERDQDLAKDFMSERIYNKHKKQTDLMIRHGRKNILKDINLTSIEFLQVANYVGEDKDKIWVKIEGSMIDYIVSSRGTYISGKEFEPESFEELWKFIKSPTGWVLDEIDPKVSIFNLLKFNSFSEENL